MITTSQSDVANCELLMTGTEAAILPCTTHDQLDDVALPVGGLVVALVPGSSDRVRMVAAIRRRRHHFPIRGAAIPLVGRDSPWPTSLTPAVVGQQPTVHGGLERFALMGLPDRETDGD